MIYWEVLARTPIFTAFEYPKFSSLIIILTFENLFLIASTLPSLEALSTTIMSLIISPVVQFNDSIHSKVRFRVL